jgi:hypothetical protein
MLSGVVAAASVAAEAWLDSAAAAVMAAKRIVRLNGMAQDLHFGWMPA